MKSYAEWAVTAKNDPGWPKCQDCQEPLSKADQKQPHGKAGRCRFCHEYQSRRFYPVFEPSFPAPDLSSLGLLDDEPEEMDLLEVRS